VYKLKITPYQIELKHPWITSRGELNTRDGFWVSISEDGKNSVEGEGDAAPLPILGTETIEQCRTLLEKFVSITEKYTLNELLEILADYRTTMPAACCGVESAIIDLQSKLGENPLQIQKSVRPLRVNQAAGTLQQPTIDNSGNSIVKLKIGIESVESEIELLKDLINTLPSHYRVRLDANQAWSMEQALIFIRALNELSGVDRVESLEEPIVDPTLEQINRLQHLSSFPIALDESISHFELHSLLNNNKLRRVVLKPTLIGGPQTTVKIARQFKQHRVEVVITSTLESHIGVDSAIQCALAIDPEQQLAHGLDTGKWLNEE
jgi:o-succinylbenzoate synthase